MKSVLNDFFDRNTTMREGTINLFDLFDLSYSHAKRNLV